MIEVETSVTTSYKIINCCQTLMSYYVCNVLRRIFALGEKTEKLFLELPQGVETKNLVNKMMR